MKRYITEFANDRDKEFKQYGDKKLMLYVLYKNRIISLNKRGFITNVETVQEIAKVSPWTIEEECLERFGIKI